MASPPDAVRAEPIASATAPSPRLLIQRTGPVLRIGLNRSDKRNAADTAMLQQLALAFGEFERDPDLRVAVVWAVGDHFTAGLDLAEVAPALTDPAVTLVPDGGIDPWQVSGTALSKPVVVAVQGTCFTLGVELILAADITVAAESTVFGQLEVSRGILPFGGATLRLPRQVGWGNAMRWLLTGDTFDAAEALRIGLVQEVVPHGSQVERALELAGRIAAQAPLAVQATLASARRAVRDGDAAAEAELRPALRQLAATEDAKVGVAAFLSRTPADFVGR